MYEKQAQDFLDKTNSNLVFRYEGHKKYFREDEFRRAVFTAFLNRRGKTITIPFGQSIADSYRVWVCLYNDEKELFRPHGPLDHEFKIVNSYDKEFDHNIVKEAMRDGREGKFPIMVGKYCKGWFKVELVKDSPTPYSLLACLETYAPETFEEFCYAYGYDSDSISALKIYSEVQRQVSDLQKLYSEEEIGELAEIA